MSDTQDTNLDAIIAKLGAMVQSVSPSLARDTHDRLDNDVWLRPELDARDRSLISVASLITRGMTGALPIYFDKALKSGVEPVELSETINHLAYYAGWSNAMAAIPAAAGTFAAHGVKPGQLSNANAAPLPLDEAAEAKRKATVSENFGDVAPGLVEYTTDYLFLDLWLRPGLAARDRSLITVAALVTSGQVAQITFHLNRAMDNGLTQTQAAEVVTHLAFYAGWPNAMSALPVFKDVFAKRAPAS